MIEVEHVDFVTIPTRDIEGARRFYGETLGLPASRSSPDEFETPNLTLALWQPEAQGVAFTPNTAGVALRVPDVAAAREHLEAQGVEFLGETVDTGVCHMGFFYDPDGNVLILHRRYAPLPTRHREVDAFLDLLAGWAKRQADVVAVAIVGSWARGDARMDSDLDVILLTEAPERYVESDAWIRDLGARELLRTQAWGVITERRIALPSGLEIEVGIGRPSWAAVDPVDPGTDGVVRGGMRIVHDPRGLLADLDRAVKPGA